VKLSLICLQVQDGVVVAVFETRNDAQAARACVSEFGIGDNTVLKCDVYDGNNFLSTSVEAMAVSNNFAFVEERSSSTEQA